MNTRPYEQSDAPLVERLLASQNWDLPNINNPHYISRVTVCEDERAVAFGFCRLIGEAYMLVDREWAGPAWRLAAIRAANSACRAEATHCQLFTMPADDKIIPFNGLDRCVTWVPKEIAKSYGKRLKGMGWEEIDRPSFVMEVR